MTGFFAGIFGIGGEINALGLTTFNLEKAVYIAIAGAISFLIDSTRIVTYIKGGTTLETSILAGLSIFIPASFVGVTIGKRCVAIFIFLFGIKLALFP